MSRKDTPGGRAASAVLRKKLGGVQARGYRYPIQQELSAALEYAAAKGMIDVLGTNADAIVAKSRVGRLEMLTSSLPSPGLLTGLAFESALAVFAFDLALTGHLVDIRTGGDPAAGNTPSPRTPTAIDLALCRPAMTAILAEFDRGLAELTGGPALGTYREAWVEQLPPTLNFLMIDQPYLLFDVTLDIGDAGRGGVFHLALPLALIEPIETVLRRRGIAPPSVESEDWSQHMRKVVAASRINLAAVIDRSQMPVAELARLEVGAFFPLPGRGLDDVMLELRIDSQRRPIGRGRLGAFGRHKAVKLTEPPDRGLIDPLCEALGGNLAIEVAEMDQSENPPNPAR